MAPKRSKSKPAKNKSKDKNTKSVKTKIAVKSRPKPIEPGRFAPAAKAALKLPVAVSTRVPVRPDSMRPRSWVERTIH